MISMLTKCDSRTKRSALRTRRDCAGVNIMDKMKNETIRERLAKRRTIFNEMHERQNSCLGHVLRMDGNLIPDIIFEGKVEGTRR